MTGQKVRWGIVGTGGIAKDFVAGAVGSLSGEVVAIGSRNPHDLRLKSDFPGIRVAGDYEALLDDPLVEAVYVATPHPCHARWAIGATRRRKHVLCEKPMGMNLNEVSAMFSAAASSSVFMAEAFMYRLHPLTAALIELVRMGAIGDVRIIRSSFGFALPELQPQHRLFDKGLGGGSILDVGGYPVSMARLLAGIGQQDGLMEPDEITGSARIGPTGVDEWSAAVMSFPNGIVAQLSCSISVWQDNVLEIMGTTGRLQVDHFWHAAGKGGGTAVIRLFRPDGSRHDYAVAAPRNIYAYQFETVSRAIRDRALELTWPGMSAKDSLANVAAMDGWLAAVGMEYRGAVGE